MKRTPKGALDLTLMLIHYKEEQSPELDVRTSHKLD